MSSLYCKCFELGFVEVFSVFWKCFGFLEEFTVVWEICGLPCFRFSEYLLGFLKVLWFFLKRVRFSGVTLDVVEVFGFSTSALIFLEVFYFSRSVWVFWKCFRFFGSVFCLLHLFWFSGGGAGSPELLWVFCKCFLTLESVLGF